MILETSGDDPAIRMPGVMYGKELARVVAIGQTQNAGDSQISLLSLEEYDDGCILNYSVQTSENEPRLRGSDPSMVSMPLVPSLLVTVFDNLGNEYGAMPGSGGGGPSWWREEIRLTPRPSTEAVRIVVRVEEIQWISHFPGQRSIMQPGPWVFEVPLTSP